MTEKDTPSTKRKVQNFVTCWVVSHLCKCTYFEGFLRLQIEGYKLLILGRFSTREKLCEMRKQFDRNFYPPSVNARYDYDVIEMRWRRIVNVNETTEIKSPVSRVPKKILS